MGRFWLSIITTIFVLYFPLISYCQSTQTFIVRVQNDLKPSIFSNVEAWYSATLRTLTSYPLKSLESKNSNRVKQTDFLHVYKTVFHGFSARLSAEQAQELSKRPGVLGVVPDRVRHLHTTRSPSFLGLTGNNPTGLITESDAGSNVIIGLIDTGISPERRSFNDVGLGPVPARWKGECIDGVKFKKTSCNKKLIGARYFFSWHGGVGVPNSTDVLSPIDSNGHGTQAASIAAGRQVANASFFGFASGVASGIAPKARIAVYKVCWAGGCLDSDILAGFDKAVEDGVDVISMSFGDGETLTYDFDAIYAGSFGAMERGIFVSASAGNGGPGEGSVKNVAPWVTTVGASTIDRKFPVDLILADGNGTVITGSSLYHGKPLDGKTYFPLIDAPDAVISNMSTSRYATYCMPGDLDEKLVSGKIVVCEKGEIPRVTKGLAVKEAGGVGVVVTNLFLADGETLIADPHLIPGLMITESAGKTVRDYITTSKDPRAKIVPRGTRLGVKPAPVVASFSSRGPSIDSSYVLKPDVIAPGVDILHAWPDTVPPSGLAKDARRTEFNILSGTSISCPHVSGVAALLKGVHPDWSPAMIRSALMTTAYTVDSDGKPLLDERDFNVSNAWGTGAGHVDPEKAADPGLVYDLTMNDYLDFLCASNYSEEDIHKITGKSVSCKGKKSTPWELNYPAISVEIEARFSKFEVAVTRTVTQVSDGASSYVVTVVPLEGLNMIVDPTKMEFKRKGEKKSYVVRISGENKPPGKVIYKFGMLTWANDKHNVTSPIVVMW